MTENSTWIPFTEIDWNSPKFNKFNIDTRDFCVGYRYDQTEHKDIHTLSKYNRFWYNEDELKEIIQRLYTESGGERDWRYLTLESNDSRVKHWNLKYIRIHRTDKGFLICNSDNVAIPKDLINLPVNKELLR